MTQKNIVQSWYRDEISYLSKDAKIIVSRNFYDYTKLLSIYYQGSSALKPFCSLFHIEREIWELAKRLHKRFVEENLYEMQKNAMRDIAGSKEENHDRILDTFFNKLYVFLLNEESSFVQNTIKINCPDYHQALSFFNKEKSVNDFLRCNERQRNELQKFFDKFGGFYKSFIATISQNVALQIDEKPKTTNTNVSKARGLEKPKVVEPKVTKNKKIDNKHKHEYKTKEKNDVIVEEEKTIKKKKDKNDTQNIKPNYNINDLYKQNFSYSQVEAPSFYDYPRIFIDDFHMMISIDYGCNGSASLGLQSNYVEQSLGNIVCNFERFHAKYNPDEIYEKQVISDKVFRYSHAYRWFGVKGWDYLSSLEIYGITAKCTNLQWGEYICYIPVSFGDSYDEYVVEIETSDDIVDSLLTERKDLFDFLIQTNTELRDFKLLEITNKLLSLSKFYDLYDFFGLDKEELEKKEDVALRLQAIMAKKSLDQFVWDSYSLDDKNDFLQHKIKAINNKEAYLRFNIVKARFIPYSKEIEISYLIRSEYSVEVYVDIDIEYNDGTAVSYQQIEVEPYDNNFEFFQGSTRIQCDRDCLKIDLIELNCSDN